MEQLAKKEVGCEDMSIKSLYIKFSKLFTADLIFFQAMRAKAEDIFFLD